jgi:hypothetical protein
MSTQPTTENIGAQSPGEQPAQEAKIEPLPKPEHREGELREMVDEGKVMAKRVGRALERPLLGAAVAGAAVLGAAALVGASEAAVGVAAAYGVYRLLRRRRHGAEAHGRQRIEESEEIRKAA